LRAILKENGFVLSEIQAYETELEECVATERRKKDYLKQLKTRRGELTKEYEEYGTQIPQPQGSNRFTTDKMEHKEQYLDECQSELKRVEEMLEQKHKEGQTEDQQLFDLERDREATRLRLRDTQSIVKARQFEVVQCQESVKYLERRLRDQKLHFDDVKQDKQQQSERYQKWQNNLESS
jgi:chromosome segregation ATPase